MFRAKMNARAKRDDGVIALACVLQFIFQKLAQAFWQLLNARVISNVRPLLVFRKLLTNSSLHNMLSLVFGCVRSIPLLSGILVIALIPAVALTWMWWYIRRHCIQLVYRILVYI